MNLADSPKKYVQARLAKVVEPIQQIPSGDFEAFSQISTAITSVILSHKPICESVLLEHLRWHGATGRRTRISEATYGIKV